MIATARTDSGLGSGGVILRIVRGHAGDGDLEGLLGAVRADIADWAAIDGGLISAQPAFREDAGRVEFLLVSTWADVESVIARGGEVTLPRGRLGASEMLRDGRAAHYELMMGIRTEHERAGKVVQVDSVPLVPRRSAAFYERIRRLWDDLVGDAGLVALDVGRRVEPDGEQAVVVSVWDSEEALDGATRDGFVSGEEMAAFYAAEPAIEHFTALSLDPASPVSTP
jgi:heme-degrading monooxygenase HmoA